MRPVDIYDRALDTWDRVKPRGKTSKVASIPAAEEQQVGQTELHQRRQQLARELAEIQWDLGGLVYEMAIRDHFRLDVVVRQAAKLQAVDAELGAVEQMVRMEDAGAAGTCPSCGAFYARGAVFCWQCGHDLLQQAAVATAASQPAAVPAPSAAPESPPSHAIESAPAPAPPGTRWPGQS